MVKNLPSRAGDVGSIPGQGTKIPHAAGQLSLCATTTELSFLNERAHVPQLERSPHATTKTQAAKKIKKINIFLKKSDHENPVLTMELKAGTP